MARDRGTRRKEKEKKVAKKKKILKERYDYKEVDLDKKTIGKLNKGKVHCSCWMCATKRAVDGPKVKELDKWERMQDEIDEHNK